MHSTSRSPAYRTIDTVEDYSENYAVPINAVCWQNTELIIVEGDGICSHHYALER
jgi:hypothetical protein